MHCGGPPGSLRHRLARLPLSESEVRRPSPSTTRMSLALGRVACLGYWHSALPPASRIELQCIFVETLLTGKVGFRGYHVSTDLDFRPAPNSHPVGGKTKDCPKTKDSPGTSPVCACLDHEYQPQSVALRALDAGGMEGLWGENAVWCSGHGPPARGDG